MTCKVLILANKWWEVVPLVSVLQHAREIKPEFSGSPYAFEIIEHKLPKETDGNARLKFLVNDGLIEVWCIEDLIHNGKDTSSSIEKLQALLRFKENNFDQESLVIAFGTAAAPKNAFSGNVIVGSKVFIFDGHEKNSESELSEISDRFGQIINSEMDGLFQNQFLSDNFVEAEKRFLRTLNNPSPAPRIFADSSYVSVGVVNVSNNQDYHEIDQQALKQFANVSNGHHALSIETTHGLIRVCLDNPFLYLSGIVNEVGAFAEEVKTKKYAQNYAASHNAAVCLAWMLPVICDQFK